jgi:predicted nucleic acid-binding protein
MEIQSRRVAQQAMSALSFFNINILLNSGDSSSPKKEKRATSLLLEHLRTQTAVLSCKCYRNTFVGATRKLGLTPEGAQQKIEILAKYRVVRFEPADVIAAIELHRLRQISFWDALIVYAARCAGADIPYGEDLQPRAALGSYAS